MNRKQRRVSEREQAKRVKRKIDWKKVSKLFKELVLVALIFAIIIALISYHVVNKHNNIRQSISEKSQITTAKVTHIKRKGAHLADYEYFINGEKYKNSIFHSFYGNIGDEICIEYSAVNPNYSIYCNEKENESIKENVVLFSVKMFGVMILCSIVLILFRLIIGNRKLMLEITSKK